MSEPSLKRNRLTRTGGLGISGIETTHRRLASGGGEYVGEEVFGVLFASSGRADLGGADILEDGTILCIKLEAE